MYTLSIQTEVSKCYGHSEITNAKVSVHKTAKEAKLFAYKIVDELSKEGYRSLCPTIRRDGSRMPMVKRDGKAATFKTVSVRK